MAMCGPRDVYREFSFDGDMTLPVGAAVGAGVGVNGAGFTVTAGAF